MRCGTRHAGWRGNGRKALPLRRCTRRFDSLFVRHHLRHRITGFQISSYVYSEGVPIIPASSVKCKCHKGMTQLSDDAGQRASSRPALGRYFRRGMLRELEAVSPERAFRDSGAMFRLGMEHRPLGRRIMELDR